MRKLLFLILTILSVNVFAESHLSEIEKRGKVQVCVWPDYYSISYLDPRSQQLRGIDIELAKELAKDLGVELEFVRSSFATLIQDIKARKCDIAMFGIGVTPIRQKQIRLTSSHLASDIYAVSSKSNRKIKAWDDIDKEGVFVAVAKGTLHEPIMKEKLKHAKLVVLDTPKAREQEVESGRADVFMTDYPFGKKMVATTDWAKLIIPTSTYHITPYAWAMEYGDDAWYERVEAFMKTIKEDGRLLQAAKNNGLEPIVVLK